MNNRLMLVVILVGVASGISARLFFESVAYLNSIVEANPILYYIAPVLAVALPYSLATLLRISCGGGSDIVLSRFFGETGVFEPREFLGYFALSILTIGFHGSGGPEGPFLVLGAGLASWAIARAGVGDCERRYVMLAGAAAGISAAFQAPLTGILYALELPYKRDLEAPAFLYAVASSLTAYLVSRLLVEPHIRRGPTEVYAQFDTLDLLLALVTGLAAALVSLLFIWLTRFVSRFKTIHGFKAVAVSSILLAITLYFVPQSRGFGYGVLNELFSPAAGFALATLLVLLLAKIIATSLTVGGGGCAGLFLPTIVIGVVLGRILWAVFTVLGFNTSLGLVIALSTSAMLAAAHKTLLTSIALTAETLYPQYLVSSALSSTIAYALALPWSLHKYQRDSRRSA
ncbi:chloride channel protein [Thermogladius sp. 4427co]|uniref:chloride channel protein n=1 Tax=Thermogladius sp. 4427co TaxID=3450718 RepID=UPI003F78D42B